MVLLASPAARATSLIEWYSSLSLWQAAVSETGVDTFSNIAPPGGDITYDTAGGYIDPLSIDFVGAFSSSAESYILEIVDAANAPTPYWNFGGPAVLASGQQSGTMQPEIVATLPANITAIALDVMTYENIVPVKVTASDGTTETVSPAVRQQTFLGFTFSAPVSTLTISVPSESGGFVLLDNFAIGAVEGGDMATPEPATFLLIGLGLVFLACLKRRRHTA